MHVPQPPGNLSHCPLNQLPQTKASSSEWQGILIAKNKALEARRTAGHMWYLEGICLCGREEAS